MMWKEKTPWLIFFAVFLCSIFAHLHLLDFRPLHNDEAVNHYFLNQISAKGYYPYSHENYHGPLYFYITWFFVYLFGDGEVGLRFSAVLFALATSALPLLLRKELGWSFVLLAQFFLSFSSSMLYMGRYAIHEMCFIFWSLLLGIATYKYVSKLNCKYLPIALISLAFLITTKETFIITLAAIGFAGLVIATLNKSLISIFTQKKYYQLGIAFALLIIIVLFSGFFSWSQGLREMFLAIPQWMDRNESDTGHFKVWGYYFSIMFGSPLMDSLSIPYWRKVPLASELFLLIGLVLFLIWSALNYKQLFFNKNFRFAIFIFTWSFLIIFVYSVPVQYKTPWLIVNLTLPLYLLTAWILSVMLGDNNKYIRIFAYCLLPVLAYLVLKPSYFYNFQEPLGKNNPYAYVHSHQNVRSLGKDILEYVKDNKGSKVLIGTKAYWPLPYYIRNLPKGTIFYQQPNKVNYSTTKSFDVMVLEKSRALKGDWIDKYYRIGDNQETRTWFRKKVFH